jgi:hypothetical protein
MSNFKKKIYYLRSGKQYAGKVSHDSNLWSTCLEPEFEKKYPYVYEHISMVSEPEKFIADLISIATGSNMRGVLIVRPEFFKWLVYFKTEEDLMLFTLAMP